MGLGSTQKDSPLTGFVSAPPGVGNTGTALSSAPLGIGNTSSAFSTGPPGIADTETSFGYIPPGFRNIINTIGWTPSYMGYTPSNSDSAQKGFGHSFNNLGLPNSDYATNMGYAAGTTNPSFGNGGNTFGSAHTGFGNTQGTFGTANTGFGSAGNTFGAAHKGFGNTHSTFGYKPFHTFPNDWYSFGSPYWSITESSTNSAFGTIVSNALTTMANKRKMDCMHEIFEVLSEFSISGNNIIYSTHRWDQNRAGLNLGTAQNCFGNNQSNFGYKPFGQSYFGNPFWNATEASTNSAFGIIVTNTLSSMANKKKLECMQDILEILREFSF